MYIYKGILLKRAMHGALQVVLVLGCHAAPCRRLPLRRTGPSASGVDAPTFEDYRGPLLDALLMGHSYGGMNITLTVEMCPQKLVATVFIITSSRRYVYAEPLLSKVTVSDWMDSIANAEPIQLHEVNIVNLSCLHAWRLWRFRLFISIIVA